MKWVREKGEGESKGGNVGSERQSSLSIAELAPPQKKIYI